MSKEKIHRHYTPRIERYTKGHEILDWESEAAHLGRFGILAEQVPLIGKSLLDVGCGVGDLYGYVTERSIAVDYTGLDLLQEMVTEAEKRYPNGKFIAGDLFDEEHIPGDIFQKNSFDIVYSSGIFNLNLGNNREFLRNALPVFFTLAKEFVVFNLLDPDHPVQSDRYAYFDPEEVLPWVHEFSHHICVVRDYVPHDFTLICKVE